MMLHMKAESRKAIADNVKALMGDRGWSQPKLSQESGVAQRTISNLLNPETGVSPKVSTVDAVASAFGLPGWALSLPNAPLEVLRTRSLAKLVECYMKSSDTGREDTLRIAEMAVRYHITSPSEQTGSS